MHYHGQNALGNPTWMGCHGHNTTWLQERIVQDLHARYPFTGPNIDDLGHKLPVSLVFNNDKQERLEKKMQLMRYTSDGEGCRLLNRDEAGRTTSIRPGHDYRPLRTATNAIEAANATRFYPHQEYKIMEAAMKCGPAFPFPKPRYNDPQQCHANRSKKASPSAFFDLVGTAEILDIILSHINYTDRASFSQSCREAAVGVSTSQRVWFVNEQNFDDAEFQDEEFEHLVQAGEEWNVTSPRGAKVLMVTMGDCMYEPSVGYRPYSSYMTIADGMLRFLRAVENRGRYVKHLVLKNVPFVDHKVLAGIVESCPKLQKLEIPGCEQFTLFSVAPFLQFLQDIQKERGTCIYFDAAPAFYKGVRWADRDSKGMDQPTYDRQGMFGVTGSDPGCDIPTALCKLLLHDILPAMKAAGQMHMLYDYSSLFREWNEALPAPRRCVALILICWEILERIEVLRAPFEKEWRAHFLDPESIPAFERVDWPESLTNQVIELETLRHWSIVRATCGNNGWKQTADRGFYSCDYQCNTGNFMEHSERMICEKCELSLPRIFFNAGLACEGCRLEARVIHEENDHLQQLKTRATEALGYGTFDEPFRTNAESNFPFSAFKRNEHGELPVKTRADFARIIDSAPSLRNFIDAAARLDVQERRSKYYKGRKTVRQRAHKYAEYPSVSSPGWEILDHHSYRRALTHEEYAMSNGNGWEPANNHNASPW